MLKKIMILLMLTSACAFAQDDWGEPEMLDSPYWDDIMGLYGIYNPSVGANDSILFFNHRNYDYGTNTAYSFYNDGQWQAPIAFPYSTDDCFVHLSEDTIVYYSAMQNYGYGGNDIWICRWQNGQWQPAINMGPIINTGENEASPSVTGNRDRICFQRGGQIMYSDIIDGEFTDPAALPEYINSALIETHPMLYPDGSLLYFNRASDPFNYNPNLIYRTEFINGLWQPPALVNDNINFYFYDEPFYGFSYKPSFSNSGARMYFGHVEFTDIGEIMMSVWAAELAISVDDNSVSLPDDITVSAYPNPFNAETRISISGDLRRVAEVAIYDVTGALVRRLAIDSTLVWNGTNVSGRHVASGLYFIKVAGDGYMEVEKLTLLR